MHKSEILSRLFVLFCILPVPPFDCRIFLNDQMCYDPIHLNVLYVGFTSISCVWNFKCPCQTFFSILCSIWWFFLWANPPGSSGPATISDLKSFLGNPQYGGGPQDLRVVASWKVFVSRNADKFKYNGATKSLSLHNPVDRHLGSSPSFEVCISWYVLFRSARRLLIEYKSQMKNLCCEPISFLRLLCRKKGFRKEKIFCQNDSNKFCCLHLRLLLSPPRTHSIFNPSNMKDYKLGTNPFFEFNKRP